MRLFYEIMLFLAQKELQIARSTGRNPQKILASCADVHRWRLALFKLENGI